MTQVIGQQYEHTSRKGDKYIVVPLVDLRQVEGFNKENLSKSLQVKDGYVVSMFKKPLTAEEKAQRAQARSEESKELSVIKNKAKTEYKLAKKELREELTKATNEFRAPSEVIINRAKDAKDKWEKVRGIRKLEDAA